MSNFDLAKAMWLRKARRQRQIRTISGANTLSVGTEVQPSSVTVKGKIKKLEGVG